MRGPFGPLFFYAYIYSMEYKQVLKGYYDTEKKVKAIDVLTQEPYFIEDRPDMKQRVERAINFNQLVAIYQRGSRNGFKYIEQDDFYIDVQEAKTMTEPPKHTLLEKPDNFICTKACVNARIS